MKIAFADPKTCDEHVALPRWLAAFAMLSALGASGCGPPSAINLIPREVAVHQGAIFGRIVILNEGRVITSQCEVVFSDEADEAKATLQLDETAWVFTAVTAGPTYLSSVVCSVSGAPLGKAEYSTRRLAFQVPGSGRAVYFGHIRIEMQTATMDRGAMMAAGMAMYITGRVLPGGEHLSQPSAATVAQSVPEKPREAKTSAPMPNADVFADAVENRFDEAMTEYQRRYGGEARLLRPEASIAGASGDTVGVLARSAPPALALGFAIGQDPAAAEARCTGAGLAWQRLDGRGFSCSGAAVDLGVSVTVKLAACAGAICEVVADAGADGAPWSTLVQRFGQLTARLAREHGDSHQRETRALPGCTAGTSNCAAAGRVVKSETWRWPDKQRVSLVLDGGPPGGAPSLRIVYRTSAFP